MYYIELKIYRTVQDIMCKLNDHELEDLRTRHFWSKAKHLKMQAKVSQGTEQFRVGSFSAALSGLVKVWSAGSFPIQPRAGSGAEVQRLCLRKLRKHSLIGSPTRMV